MASHARDGADADAVGLRDQAQRLTGHAPLVGFGFLECREDWRPPELHASRHCALAPLAGSFSNQRPLEVSETAEDGEHEATVWRGAIGPGIVQAFEECAPLRPDTNNKMLDLMKHEDYRPFAPVIINGDCRGHILRSAKGFRAFDRNDHELGTFESPDAAIAALLEAEAV